LYYYFKTDEAERIYNYFNHPYKKKHSPTKNQHGEEISVYYAYDLLELTNSAWYAVILRNIPATATIDNIKQFCSAHTTAVQYIINPIQIKNSMCTLAILTDLDEAEKLCKALNKKELGKRKWLKVNLHPKCCRVRKGIEKSHYSQYFKSKSGFVLPEHKAPAGLSIPKYIDNLYSVTNSNKVKKPAPTTKTVEIKARAKTVEVKKEPLITTNTHVNNEKGKNMFTSLLGCLITTEEGI
jgi:hypothetical protein